MNILLEKFIESIDDTDLEDIVKFGSLNSVLIPKIFIFDGIVKADVSS